MAYIRKSPAYIAEWMGLAKRMIPIDNRTRWNSWYKMLLILIKKMKYINKYYQNYKNNLIEDFLSYKD